MPLGLDVAVLSGRRNAATERDVWSLSGVELPGDETMSGRRNAAAGRNMRTVGAMCDRQHDVLFGSRFEPADLGACPAREIVPADLFVTVLSGRPNAAAERNVREWRDADESDHADNCRIVPANMQRRWHAVLPACKRAPLHRRQPWVLRSGIDIGRQYVRRQRFDLQRWRPADLLSGRYDPELPDRTMLSVERHLRAGAAAVESDHDHNRIQLHGQ